MSFKNLFKLLSTVFALFVVLQSVSAAQTKINAQIEILAINDLTSTVRVAGKINNSQKSWTFIERIANAQNLTGRISELAFFDDQNQTINFKKALVNSFETDFPATGWSYELNLTFPPQAAEAAHVSSLSATHGLMMLGDLLPDLKNADGSPIPADAAFILPNNWKIASSEKRTGENNFSVQNFINAVFLIGNFNEQTVRIGQTETSLAQIGDWSFTADETFAIVGDLMQRYEKIFGALPASKIQILLVPLPQKFNGEMWEAETRGRSVIVLSARSSYKSRALAKLHEQLRHELFHLWIPNALNLSGSYDWFYEGFALYQALKIGASARQIRFEDFLDVLGRAFDMSLRISQNEVLNLLDASRRRWSSSNSDVSALIYAKGMIVAFLCDLALLKSSNDKKSLDNIFRQLFLKPQKSVFPRQDGNAVILAALKEIPQLRFIIEKYVESNNVFDVAYELNESGLQTVTGARFTRLNVQEKLTKRQKKLLANFGYQQS